MINEQKKTQIYFPVFLLIAASLLTIQGILGTPFEFFSGVKMAVLFTLGSMFGKLEMLNANPLGRYMARASGAAALVVGSILLAPYFWPGRSANLRWLVIYGITAFFAWVYLMGQLKGKMKFCSAFGYFCFFPPVLLISTLMAMYTYDGTLFAALIVSLYYLVMGFLLMAHGIKIDSRLCLNGGLFLLWGIITAIWISFFFVLPEWPQIVLALLVVVVLNICFKTMEGMEKK
ncbi:MAG: hypothetical protein LKE29_00150 [Acidaminococcaceae bacterium]|jgi:hypothetical protein|nr:hypothetical protein [Acidaminococcaceae bacterium]